MPLNLCTFKDSVNLFVSESGMFQGRFALKKFCIALIILLIGMPARAAVSTLVADVRSGYVLHATNADAKQFPASLTK